MHLGVFLTALGLMFLEILATRVLGIVEGPETVVYVVAVAMLGMGAAGSFLSVRQGAKDEATAMRSAATWCLLAGLGAVSLFVLATLLKEATNAAADRALQAGGMTGLLAEVIGGRTRAVVALGAILAVPYFFYGGALAIVFRGVRDTSRPRVYFVDLLGASLGCFLALFALETTGYGVPLAIALGVPFLATAAFRRVDGHRAAAPGLALAAVVVALALIPATRSFFEPTPALGQVARLYNEPKGTTAEELWHTWDSYSRVAAIRQHRPDGTDEYRMALGQGEGHARVRAFAGPDAPVDPPFLPGDLVLAGGRPARVLVLFAGAAQDLVALDAMCGGQTELVGVELNRHIIEWAKDQPFSRIAEFTELPRVHFHVAEAREYLERDRTRYDAILLSWSGASLQYYTGAAGFGPRFVYTKEGYEALLDHLTPAGRLIILNTSKVKALATLRGVLKARGKNAAECVAVLGKDDEGGGTYDWRGFWDENRVVVKPSGLSDTDVTKLRDVAAKWSSLGVSSRPYEIHYAPNAKETHGSAFGRVLLTDDLDRELAALGDPNAMVFSLATDDRPFVLDVFPTSAYLSLDFWMGNLPKELPSDHVRAQWNQRAHHARSMLVFFVVSLLLILGPPLVRRKALRVGQGALNHVVFFALLGASFMLVEVGLVQKMSLYLGHPGRALAVVLGALILFTGIGSQASTALFRRGLSFRSAALLSAISAAALLFAIEGAKDSLLSLTTWVRIPVLFFSLGIPGFFMGQMFPQALARVPSDAEGLVPWGLAINALAGTLAAGLAVVFAQSFGYRAVVLMGVAGYVFVALMPHGIRTARGS